MAVSALAGGGARRGSGDLAVLLCQPVIGLRCEHENAEGQLHAGPSLALSTLGWAIGGPLRLEVQGNDSADLTVPFAISVI